ncbi:hypothetical protein HN680_07025, partial [Candidatus Peregrinibacteria bacterium]|nr:hypothetical protein [Candidatus Peregrinibacteria bacterium]
MGVEDRPQPEVIDSPDSSIDDGQVEVVTEQNLDSARETMRDRIANLYEDVSESDHEIADELKSELDSLAYNLVDVNEQELEAILERTESALTTIEATFQGGLEEVLGEELGSEEIVDRKPLRSRRA